MAYDFNAALRAAKTSGGVVTRDEAKQLGKDALRDALTAPATENDPRRALDGQLAQLKREVAGQKVEGEYGTPTDPEWIETEFVLATRADFSTYVDAAKTTGGSVTLQEARRLGVLAGEAAAPDPGNQYKARPALATFEAAVAVAVAGQADQAKLLEEFTAYAQAAKGSNDRFFWASASLRGVPESERAVDFKHGHDSKLGDLWSSAADGSLKTVNRFTGEEVHLEHLLGDDGIGAIVSEIASESGASSREELERLEGLVRRSGFGIRASGDGFDITVKGSGRSPLCGESALYLASVDITEPKYYTVHVSGNDDLRRAMGLPVD